MYMYVHVLVCGGGCAQLVSISVLVPHDVMYTCIHVLCDW